MELRLVESHISTYASLARTERLPHDGRVAQALIDEARDLAEPCELYAVRLVGQEEGVEGAALSESSAPVNTRCC